MPRWDVICAGSVLLCGRILLPSVATFHTCKPCRCPTAFLHAPHLWRRLVNSITMVAHSHKYWTTSSTTQSCHWQVDNAGWMSPWLAIIWRRLSPSSTSPGISQTIVEGLAANWCHKSVEGRLAIGYGGQFHFSGRPHNATSRFWSSPASLVTAESFSDRPRPL